MKKLTRYSLVVACAIGAVAFTPKISAAESGCCGMAQAGACPAMQKLADEKGGVKPDLLTTCPVSGEKLGEMGDAYVFTYQGQEVKLCCKSCKKKFDKDPEKYLKIIRAADKK
jgi:YHS domain-containing protein